MKRTLYHTLLKWKTDTSRKPLMLYGARQVGKTYLLKEFGRNEFENTVYINCYKNAEVETLFRDNADISRILLGLSAIAEQDIIPGKTFLIMDEAQDIPEVVASLKYFCEDMPELHVAVAGSLLGVLNMTGISFPTGKVDIMHLHPMTFIEFIDALGETRKKDLLENEGTQDLVNAILPKYTELLRQYYFVGGMPEAILEFIHSKSPEKVRKIQTDILAAYDADISKHAGAQTQRARMVFESIPSQLARENKKFVFGAVRKGARAADFEIAIQWLVDAGLVYKVNRVSKAAIPLNFYKDSNVFKLFLLDVGLLGAMSNTPPSIMLIGNNIFEEFKGAFTENFVLTQIMPEPGCVVAYYSKENSSVEVDFIVQAANHVLPIEVKAEDNVKSKSLRQFVTIDNSGKDMHGYRFSMKGFAEQDWMSNIPLFAVSPFIQRLNNGLS